MRERRRHPRYPVATTVFGRVVYPIGRPQFFSANTFNVSLGGFAVSFDEPEDTKRLVTSLLLTKNQSVSLRVELPDTGHIVEGTGGVRWVSLAPNWTSRQRLEAGIELTNMVPLDILKWQEFVNLVAQSTGEETVATVHA